MPRLKFAFGYSFVLAAPLAASAGMMTASPCPAGTSRATALDAAARAAASGDMAPVTGDCQSIQTPLISGQPSQGSLPVAKTATPTTAAKPAVSDQHTTTGAPPSPGLMRKSDGGSGGGSGGGLFDSLSSSSIKGGLALGGALGMAFGFATPVGLIGGALIGAVIGAVVFSGVIGKLFGGGSGKS